MKDTIPEEAQSTSTPRTLAVVDIGATAIRAEIAEACGGRVRLLESLYRSVNLGRDTFAGGKIDPDKTEQCVAVLTGFREVMSRYGVVSADSIHAVATSVRDAANIDFFLDRVYMATGIKVRVIAEIEVHRLAYMALQTVFEARPSLAHDEVLAVEIGGGSSKLILIRNGFVEFAGSVKLGSLRLRELVESDRTPVERVRKLLEQNIRRIIEPVRRALPVDTVPCLIMEVGDCPFAVSQFFAGHPDQPVVRVSRKMLAEAERVIMLPPETLVRRYHMPLDEAETAGPAMLTHVRLARLFAAREVYAARVNLRQGLLLEAVAGSQWTARFREQIMRSALALGHRYGFDEAHAKHVSALAVRLFRELRPEHRLSERHEILLQTAGLLHDIGAFVGNSKHHKHSMYLLAHSEPFGLTAHDIKLTAVIVRYHRRALPCAGHAEFMSLDSDDRAVVLRLAALLRVADALDRGHSQAIRNLRITLNPKELSLVSNDVEDVTLEQMGLREKGGLFELAYGRRVTLRAVPDVTIAEYHGYEKETLSEP